MLRGSRGSVSTPRCLNLRLPIAKAKNLFLVFSSTVPFPRLEVWLSLLSAPLGPGVVHELLGGSYWISVVPPPAPDFSLPWSFAH